MANENKTESSKRGIDLLDMTAKITLDGADECIAKLEHIESLLQKIIELEKVVFNAPAENLDALIEHTLIKQLKDIRKVSAYEDHEGLPQLTTALCEVVNTLKNFRRL